MPMQNNWHQTDSMYQTNPLSTPALFITSVIWALLVCVLGSNHCAGSTTGAHLLYIVVQCPAEPRTPEHLQMVALHVPVRICISGVWLPGWT